MKKLVALLLALIYLFGSAMSESATPTDLNEYEQFDDDDWGYIEIKFERKVYISMNEGPKELGDEIILTAVLVDFLEDDIVTFQWQYAANPPDWIFIDDANEQMYTFILNETNWNYWYRVIVELVGE